MTERLPIVGGDNDEWGTINNAFHLVAHNSDGTLKTAAIESAVEAAGFVTAAQFAAYQDEVSDYFRWTPRAYGAAMDGTTDDFDALQAAIDAHLAAGFGRVHVDGPIAFAGSLQITGDTVVGFHFAGAGRGTVLTQLTDNVPMFNINLTTQGHSWTFEGFSATWDPTETSADTAAWLFHLDGASGNFYNSEFRSITLSNAYGFINTDGMLFWGNAISWVMATGIHGGFYELDGAAGQPNNSMTNVYVGAQSCTLTIFNGNALVMNFFACEVNQVSNGVKIAADSGGGYYRFAGEFSVEVGAWSTANRALFEFPDCHAQFDVLKIEGTCTAATRIFQSQGAGFIDCAILRVGIVPSGSGHVFFWHVGAAGSSDLADPLKYLINGRVNIGKVRFYGGLADGSGIEGYNRTTNYVAPTNMGSTAGSDAGQISEWLDPARIDYAGDAAYTFGVGSPAHVIFNTTLTANRDVTLPHEDFMFSGMKYRVSKNVTGGDVVIKGAGGSTIYTIPAATKGFIELTYNRSIGGGPSLWWSVTAGGTWT